MATTPSIGSVNMATDEDLTVTAYSEDDYYPADNQNLNRVKPWRTSDKKLEFDGVAAGAYVADHADFDITGDFTFEWRGFLDKVTGVQTLCDKYITDTGYNVQVVGDEIRVRLGKSAATMTLTTTAANLTVDTNTLIKTVYDASAAEISFWVNHVEIARGNNSTQTNCTLSGTIPTSIDTNSENFSIGINSRLNDNHFDGKKVHVRIIDEEHDNAGYLNPSICIGAWNLRSDLTDISGNGHDLTWTRGLDLNGTNEFAYVADHADFDATTNLTLQGTVYIESGFSFAWLCHKADATTGYAAVLTAARKLRFYPDDSGSNYWETTNAVIDLDTWSFWKMEYSGGVRMWVNGSEVPGSQTGLMPGSLSTNAVRLTVGANDTGGSSFGGIYGDFALSKSTAGDGDPIGVTIAEGYWLFQDNLNDSSGNGHTLTGNNIDSTDYTDTPVQGYSSYTGYQLILFELPSGSTMQPTSVFFDRRHNLTDTATIKVMVGSPYATYDEETTINVTAGEAAFADITITARRRIWFEIHDAANTADYLEIIKIWFGDMVDLSHSWLNDMQYSDQANILVTECDGGQRFGIQTTSTELWKMSATYEPIDTTDQTNMATIIQNGKRGTIPMVVMDDNSEYRLCYLWQDKIGFVENSTAYNTFSELIIEECGIGL